MAICKTCKSNKVTWRQSKAGKWYLVNADNSFHSKTCKPVTKAPIKRSEPTRPPEPTFKIEILSFIGSEDPTKPSAITTCSNYFGMIRALENHDPQVTRIRVNGVIQKIQESDPDLAPYSIVRIKYPSFYLPEVPYSFEVALQRKAAAQGSVALAKLVHTANYNGHYNHLTWNDYRSYYVGGYTWAGRNVWYRGTDFKQALEVAKRVYKSQGLGASLVVTPQNANDLAVIEADKDFTTEKDDRSWWSWKHQEACYCVDYMGGVNYKRFELLSQATSPEHFQQLQDDHRASLRQYQETRGKELSDQLDEACKTW